MNGQRTMIPISVVRQMIYKETTEARKVDPEEMLDPATPLLALMWCLSQYELGEEWDIFDDFDEEED